jgi:hypothetical protein
MTSNPDDRSNAVEAAPDPDSPEFLQEQNTVERVNPGKTADEHATDATAISTDPSSTSERPS